MTQIMTLVSIFRIVQHYNSCHEVDNLTGREKIYVRSAVFSSVAVTKREKGREYSIKSDYPAATYTHSNFNLLSGSWEASAGL